MGLLSKHLNYTCYEAAHTWHPSCSRASLEVLIIAFVNGMKIYSVIYLLSALVTKRKFTKNILLKILHDNIQSACFLSVNAGAFISAHCIVRALLQHFNYISAAYIPGFFASLLAILVERQSRRSLLAIYVTNVASECLWNTLVSQGTIKALPYGQVMVFSLTMSLFGYHFKKAGQFSPLVQSIMSFILGKNESEKNRRNTKHESINCKKPTISKNIFCSHSNSCWSNIFKIFGTSFCKGFFLQSGIQVLSSFSKILVTPSTIFRKIFHPSSLRIALFFSWFATSFQTVCCLARNYSGQDKPSHGALAGAVAGLGLLFSPSTSLTLYAFWKAIEALWEEGQRAGHLPTIPGGVEILYGLSSAYLFHLAIMENFNLKPSYWQFLLKLTNGRVAEVNRFLLHSYGLQSNKDQKWPKYDLNHLTEDFKKEYADRLHLK